MKAKILSMNTGHPEQMEWNGRSVLSSMHKRPVAGPLNVHMESIDGNSFASPQVHGAPDSVLYAFGMPSIMHFMKELGLPTYQPGAVGETLTVDDLDEQYVSVGDIFQIGEVRAQATFPRIPCGRVNYRMQNADGQKAMQRCGRSGVYFRILTPGLIHAHDTLERIELAHPRFSIFDLYRKVVNKETYSEEERETILANGAFPANFLLSWSTHAPPKRL